MKRTVALILALCIAVGLPLVGVAWMGMPVSQYLEFPPTTRYVQHEPFAWPVFIGLAALILAVVLPFEICVLRSRGKIVSFLNQNGRGFPWWGQAGLLFGIAAWVLAWTRFDWFEPFQRYTFSPLWFSYILVLNAWTWKRSGRCMMIDRPRMFAALFVLSAVFWWYFEYLNRFVQNWYYEGVGFITPVEYGFFATLPFSTVLPAVLGTYELLKTNLRIGAGLDDFVRISVKGRRGVAVIGLLAAGGGMAGLAVWPDYLFPLLWLSPLLIITCVKKIAGEATVFSPVGEGRWRNLYLLALASFMCGGFWEMWNYLSLAQWKYAVPFVGDLKLFEMPLLGYAGYLPFGIECAVVAQFAGFKIGEEGEKEPQMNTDEHGLRKEGEMNFGKMAYFCSIANKVVIAMLAVYFFIIPVFIIMYDIADPNIGGREIPKIAWRVHKAISPGYAKWAKKRIESGIAAHLNLYDVPSTEWPIFGSVFYLMATENLQKEWERNNSLSPQAPAVYARETIEAAKNIVVDSVHHTWVKQHWGDDYMHTENVFFRSLIIAGLTSYGRLTGSRQYNDMLKDQCLTLAEALDRSPHGVLNDYPSECYPIDVLGAIAYIKRADDLLGIDQSEFIARSVRGFKGEMLDKRGLVPYRVVAETGAALPLYPTTTPGKSEGPSRGIGNSYVLIFAPELWPEIARQWYALYEKHFWQDLWWASGWREFPKDMPHLDWGFDVDAGPIIGGFSPAANAYGLAAARANGRFDHAYTLSAQVIAACWPMPHGRLLGAQILSNPKHAPYLGEVNLLWLMTHTPSAPSEAGQGATKGRLPPFVFLMTGFYGIIGLVALIGMALSLRNQIRKEGEIIYPYAHLQCGVWLVLLAVFVILLIAGRPLPAMVSLLLSQFVPRRG